MARKNYFPEIIKFVTVEGSKIKPYATKDKNGVDIYVCDLKLMRIIANYFGARYEILTPPDGEYGVRLPNGSWTGMIGMVQREEADLAMSGVAVTAERFSAVNYSYPYLYSTLTFMTDAPEPIPKNLAILYPFCYTMWIALAGVTMVMSFVLYAVLNRKKPYQRVLLGTVRGILQNSIDFKTRKPAVKMVAFAWILGMFVVASCYKAVLLSFLSFPTMIGIRDIPELSRAAATASFKCIQTAGSYMARDFVKGSDPSWKAIGECLLRNENSGNALETFLAAQRGKAYVGSKLTTVPFQRLYYVSEDNFNIEYYGIPFSKAFCCPKDLNRIISRFIDSGIFWRLRREEHFFKILQTPSLTPEYAKESHSISLGEMTGAFYILISGWIAGFVTLLIEIFIQKYS